MNKKILVYHLIIAVTAGLFFISFIGRIHLFDWDEINFAESAREMILTHDYLTVRAFFEPFWEKPPLFIWLQVLSMKIFGINEFAARFPNSICGILTLLVLFNIGRKLYNDRFGLIWIMTFACSLLPFIYFKSGIIDPWFNLLIFIGIYFWVKAIDNIPFKKEVIYSLFSAVAIGLAVLTKGPVAVLIFGLVAGIMFLLNGFRLGINWKSLIIFILAFSITGGFWFILQILAGHSSLVYDFLVYQVRLFKTEDAGHGGFPLYHFVVLLFGVFPASVFAIQGHKYVGKKDFGKLFHSAMIVLLWVVLILFSIVRTKIVHYSSLCYFPITYLAAFSVNEIMEGKFKFRIWQKFLISIIGFFAGLIVILLPVFAKYKQLLIDKGFITDRFTAGNLQADPGWNFMHALIGLILIVGVILAVFFLKKSKLVQMTCLYGASLIFIYLAMIFITPGAERISQNAAIEFIKESGGKNAYVYAFYKSYAPPYYSNEQVPANTIINNEQWLTTGEIDKDVYFLARNYDKETIQDKYRELIFLYEKNGYIFYVRHTSLNNTILNDRK
jgi:4-amino-4-deoxy-L-arabinose transferase-like glycosyltransferase